MYIELRNFVDQFLEIISNGSNTAIAATPYINLLLTALTVPVNKLAVSVLIIKF